jgi:hypothetical protein
VQRGFILDQNGMKVLDGDVAAQVGGTDVDDGFGVEVVDDAVQAGEELLAEDVLADGDENGTATATILSLSVVAATPRCPWRTEASEYTMI